MSSLYVANENGDWWLLSPGDVIYAMRPDQIPAGASDADDKFEDVIMQYGVSIENLYEDLSEVIDS